MAKKKRTAAPVQALAPQKVAVNHGDVFTAFVLEANSIRNEVAARRAFAEEVSMFLGERGLTQDFETWRATRQQSRG